MTHDQQARELVRRGKSLTNDKVALFEMAEKLEELSTLIDDLTDLFDDRRTVYLAVPDDVARDFADGFGSVDHNEAEKTLRQAIRESL